MIVLYIGENKMFEKMYFIGEIEFEFIFQGIFVECCVVGGKGIFVFYIFVVFGMVVQMGELFLRNKFDGILDEFFYLKDVKVFNGKSYLFEYVIVGDVVFVKVYKVDRLGNCQFRLVVNNFNGVMGRNVKMMIVEVENIVELGEIVFEVVYLFGIYVQRVVQFIVEKGIEKYMWVKDFNEEVDFKVVVVLGSGEMRVKREMIVKRVVKEFKNGMYVNFGIGMFMFVLGFVGEDVEVMFQSENGIFGFGFYL